MDEKSEAIKNVVENDPETNLFLQMMREKREAGYKLEQIEGTDHWVWVKPNENEINL